MTRRNQWNGSPSPLWKLQPQSIEEALKAYQAGESANSVARRYSVTLHTIRYHAKQAGLWHGRRIPDLATRFWQKVCKTDSCWLWTGASIPNGYGTIGVNQKTQMVHRVAYELTKGKIPGRLYLDHLCRNKLCVNPDHLEPVTNAENVRRGMALVGRKYTIKE